MVWAKTRRTWRVRVSFRVGDRGFYQLSVRDSPTGGTRSAGAEEAGLDVVFTAPITDHDASDAAGDRGRDAQQFWRDHQSSKVNSIRTRSDRGERPRGGALANVKQERRLRRRLLRSAGQAVRDPRQASSTRWRSTPRPRPGAGPPTRSGDPALRAQGVAPQPRR